MSRCTTAHCFKLEVSVIKTSEANGWRHGAVTWTRFGQQQNLSYALLTIDGQPHLVYCWGDFEEGTHTLPAIPYERLPTAIGGSRLFWRCPTPSCGRYVTALYCPRGNLTWGRSPYFYCRHCYGLPYGSQYESKTAKVWRLYRQLGDELTDPTTPWRRFKEVSQIYGESVLPGIEREMDRSDRMLERILRLAQKPLGPGRPSKRKERESLRAARAAEKAAQPKRPPGRPREKRPYIRRSPFVLSERTSEMQAYCPRCRDRRDMLRPKPVTFSNGRPAVQGNCAACKATMAQIVKRDDLPREEASAS